MKFARTVIIVLLAFLSIHANAQTAGIEFDYGTASYSMSGLKAVNTDLSNQAGLNFDQTSNFENGESYGGTFVVGIGKFETGVDYRHYLTKAEMVDNTGGGVKFTEELAGKSYGLLGKYPVYHSTKFQFKVGLLVSMYYTKAKFITDWTGLGEQYVSRYQSKAIALSPFVEPVYNIQKWCYVGVRASYCYDFGADLRDHDDKTQKLLDPKGNTIEVNWTGMRAEIFLGFRMNNE